MAYTFRYGDRPIDGVTIQRAVGRGGFGEVYYAVSDSGKQLALKYLRENPEVELRGISHVMNLKSPHLITIYDVKQDAHNDPWVMMEYVSGPSLRDILNNEPNGLGAGKAAFFLEGMAKGLSYLHERGIVHRDMKPGNIFYDDGYVKIGDYGLSKHISVSKHSGNTISVGTVHYMAPEIGSGSYTRAIDIYALGVMLYEMMTGRLPFAGSSMGEILMRHLSERPDLSALPEPFRGVCAKALAKRPEDRFQDVNEMVDIIKASTDVAAGMSTFDPKTLTQVPRATPEQVAERTMTAGRVPPPPPIALDVRDVAPVDALPPVVQKRMKRYQRKLDQKISKLERKLGVSRAATPTRPSDGRRVKRWVHTLVLAAVAVGVSVGLGFASDSGRQPEIVILSTMFFLVGGTLGALFAYFKVLRRGMNDHGMFDRLVYGALGAAPMAIGLGPASEIPGDALMPLILAPIAALVICNWTERIEEGRRGNISGWAMFWPIIIGLVVAGIWDLERFKFTAMGLNAALALLIPAAAAMWPMTRAEYVGAPGGPLSDEGEYGPYTGPAAERGARQAPAPVDPEKLRAAEAPTLSSPAALVQDAAAKAEVWQREAPEAAFEFEQPSFVGRAANAGMSFVGKLCLLIGLLWAGFYHTKLPTIEDGNGVVEIGGSHFRVAESDGRSVEFRVPPVAVIAPIILGGFLLLIARRSDGGGHFLRGLLGTIAGVGATLLLVGPAGRALAPLLMGGDFDISDDRELAPIIIVGAVLALAVGLVFWPKAPRRRRRAAA